MGRTEGVTQEHIRKRLNYEMTLKAEGYSQFEILDKVNEKTEEEGWGHIGMRQLMRDFATFYRETTLPTIADEREAIKGLRQAYLADLEALMSKLRQELETKKDWAPFEKQKMVTALFDMKVKYMTIRGWNNSLTRKTEDEILKEAQKASFDEKLDGASYDLMHTAPEVIQDFINSMGGLRAKLKEERLKKLAEEPEVIIIDDKEALPKKA